MNLKSRLFTPLFLILFVCSLFSGQLTNSDYQKLDPKLALFLDKPELRVSLSKTFMENSALCTPEFLN